MAAPRPRRGSSGLRQAQRQAAKARRACCRAYDELLETREELESTVEDAFEEMSFAPLERLFARAEAAEVRYRLAVLAAIAAESTARETGANPVLDMWIKREGSTLH
jgi:hypothetical protein